MANSLSRCREPGRASPEHAPEGLVEPYQSSEAAWRYRWHPAVVLGVLCNGTARPANTKAGCVMRPRSSVVPALNLAGQASEAL